MGLAMSVWLKRKRLTEKQFINWCVIEIARKNDKNRFAFMEECIDTYVEYHNYQIDYDRTLFQDEMEIKRTSQIDRVMMLESLWKEYRRTTRKYDPKRSKEEIEWKCSEGASIDLNTISFLTRLYNACHDKHEIRLGDCILNEKYISMEEPLYDQLYLHRITYSISERDHGFDSNDNILYID